MLLLGAASFETAASPPPQDEENRFFVAVSIPQVRHHVGGEARHVAARER